MIALADHGNDFGEHIHPSIDYLAWKTGYHRRNVQKILRKLEELQLLIPVAYEQGGRGLATVYEMHLENGTTKPPFKRRERPKKDGFNATVSDGQKDGDVTTLSEKSAKRVASHTQRVASHTQKGGVGATPTVIEPSYEPSEEPAPISRSRKNEEAAEPEPEPPPFRPPPPRSMTSRGTIASSMMASGHATARSIAPTRTTARRWKLRRLKHETQAPRKDPRA